MAIRRPRITALDKDIASRVRQLRLDRGMSQPTVAGALGVTYQSYQKIEGGKVAFRATTLNNLATLFGVSLASLTGDGASATLRNAGTASHIAAILSRVDEDAAKELLDQALKLKQAA